MSFRYGSTSVLSDCSFVVPENRVTLLVGRSGIGKTTIARLLLGFIRPDSGIISVSGVNTATASGKRIRGLMSYVSQEDCVVDDTVRDNLDWTTDATHSNDQLADALDLVGIATGANVLDRPACELSFGQQKRLSLARILLDRSPIMILDEPLAGVDGMRRRRRTDETLRFSAA